MISQSASSPDRAAMESSDLVLSDWQREAARLVLYQSVWADEIAQSWLNLLELLVNSRTSTSTPLKCWQAYGNWFKGLAKVGLSWQEYLVSRILGDDNPFSWRSQQQDLETLPPALLDAVRWDLRCLQKLYQVDPKWLGDRVLSLGTASGDRLPFPIVPTTWLKNTKQHLNPVEIEIRTKLATTEDWGALIGDLAAYYRACGTGIFAQYRAFRWQSGQLIGIKKPDPVTIDALCGYESQKEQLLKNTEFLLAGYSALNILLYGSRGSGKSSLVKGLLNEYSDGLLRLIEVAKSQLQDLPDIVELLRDLPHKFIIFVDDLSFEEDDEAFKALKVVLEGSMTARPANVVVYATSNRRHLVREFFGDRPRPKDADEVQSWDTVQEKLSFSDRFGLTLTFEAANQDTYLSIVRHLADIAQIDLPPADLDYRALQWATRHNGRSGRSARQFIDFLSADLAN